ncbi:hypothetical protein ACWGRK_09820 [Saccharomonospora azurea]|uniref:Uncharacterized protein n=1 Tax=Saccharomonospora azurea NA-128 TaxID=882081 RepID=H8GE85_9PSEU|nr:hypothetical protein [Saccharomonospora azurea]EHK89412.1 hypothetical protein SZMC14600_00975 [Saccharomonospora azurea SZMC 14600]EHY90967.1 hypothetical protein SacazDRAFT_04117 [Saccharomonospora azurea NA-128]
MFDGVARWWDGFELWLAQQWFPIQFVLVAAVLLPLSVGMAWVIHRGVDVVADRLGGLRRTSSSAEGSGNDGGKGSSDAVS